MITIPTLPNRDTIGIYSGGFIPALPGSGGNSIIYNGVAIIYNGTPIQYN